MALFGSGGQKLFGEKKRLGEQLIDDGLITQQQLDQALAEQKEKGGRLGETLMALGYMSAESFSAFFQKAYGISAVKDEQLKNFNQDILQYVDEKLIREKRVFPFGGEGNTLYVAMAEPNNLGIIDDIEMATGMSVEAYYAPQTSIDQILDKLYGKKSNMEAADQFIEQYKSEFGDNEDKEEEDTVGESPIVKIVRAMIQQSVREGASDIHIEPMEKQLRVRSRVDGMLQEDAVYPLDLLGAMTSRIKIISGLDISEKRKPQDGRLTYVVDGVEFDVRVSILPTVYGEKTVMRLTKKQGLTQEKKYLGLYPDDEARLDGIMNNPHGIILVTGPTGSGKSTTCYTVLNELNKPDVNIITVEDPVEANIAGINQVQVNVKAGLTFASALRSILRQDPDIIMIGEIRDGETAQIAVQASITGHLVISTLHTNSTSASVTRLIDMGVEPYMIGDAVVGIIAQRLVRRLCPDCKVPHEATQQEKILLDYPLDKPLTIYDPGGCEKCGNGYKGRRAIYEIMPISAAIRRVLHDTVTAELIEQAAVSEGMNTLRMAGARNVIEGITTVAEMVRVAYDMDAQTAATQSLNTGDGTEGAAQA
ncbi:MAG: Flp pilus assembly complex ATPase component TadA [Lachnospiraceae bacterium]|nr:Flp pilus assembly complex ATPase component TadA [Lachnospiraceae bacterium]